MMPKRDCSWSARTLIFQSHFQLLHRNEDLDELLGQKVQIEFSASACVQERTLTQLDSPQTGLEIAEALSKSSSLRRVAALGKLLY